MNQRWNAMTEERNRKNSRVARLESAGHCRSDNDS
jgi:hypothetical protein